MQDPEFLSNFWGQRSSSLHPTASFQSPSTLTEHVSLVGEG